MNNTMEYKGYIGSVEFSEADQILYGKVQGIRSLISYELSPNSLKISIALSMIILNYALLKEKHPKKHLKAASMFGLRIRFFIRRRQCMHITTA